MGNDELQLKHCTMALDMLPEFILIASFPPDASTNTAPTEGKQMEGEKLTLTKIMYMNAALRGHLGAQSHEEYNGGQAVILTFSEGRHYCKVTLHKNNGENKTLNGVGKVEKSEGVFAVKLYEWELSEYDIAMKYFDVIALFMTVIELGPDDGTYEWRHICPNKWTFNFYGTNYEKINSLSASERNPQKQRAHLYKACIDSRDRGIQIPQIEETLDTYLPLLGSTIGYMGKNPLTNGDMFACATFNPTQVKAATDRLTELGDFFEHAPMMMGAVMLVKGKLSSMYSNQAAADFCGIPKNEMKGDVSRMRFYQGDLHNQFISYFEQSRQYNNKPLQFSVCLLGPDGKNHYMNTTVSAIKYEENIDSSTHVFIMLDITPQKEAEMALERHKNSLEETVVMRTLELQEKEQRFRSLVSNAPNIILSIDREGVITFSNRDFISDNPGALLGRYLHTIVDEGPKLMEKIRMLFETSKSFMTEVKLLETDVWLNLSAGPMSETLAIIVATDITEIKQLSDELHHALATKSRFLANMSHEIRTPLSGIIGMSRILMDGRLTMDQTECVATIQYCGETLLSVINDVLDYTKLEATGMTLDSAELSLHQCVEESLYTVLSAAQKKGLELIVDIDHTVPDRILGDMLRLRQVMTNLLNNAVKFTDTGYVMVSLTGEEILGTDEWKFICTIKDTGLGVPPESQGKLFKMFSQVDASTTRKYGGTGIGLALARKFLEMMDGEIDMRSTGVPGEGSVFYFSIIATLVPFVPVSPAASLSSPRWLISTTNIFINEELLLASEVLKKRLVGKGFTSIQLFNKDPQEVFKDIEVFLASLKPQDNRNVLIFCDVDKLTPGKHYPVFDHANVAIVLMGYTQPKNFAADFPNCEFLRKPIKETTFVRCLKEIWSRFDTKHAQPTLNRVPSNKMSTALHFPLNIMIVEDNDMNQKVVRRVFQHLGYSKPIPIANHGKEALEMIEKNGIPDLILMDLQMPVLDGVQTTKIIRSKYTSGWPYIASMTADVFPEDRKKCLEAGMNDFLTKPIRVEQVQLTLQKCYLLKLQRNPNMQ